MRDRFTLVDFLDLLGLYLQERVNSSLKGLIESNMKYEELILSVDCSTTAAKAVVWDLSGNAIAIGKREFGQVTLNQDGLNKILLIGGKQLQVQFAMQQRW